MIRRNLILLLLIAGAAGGAGATFLWLESPPEPGDRVVGPSADVVHDMARGLLIEAADARVVLLGEDHRSPLPDAIGAAMLREEAFDCVGLELHQDLQPAIDAYAAGKAWHRTVWPAVRQVFGTSPLALGQDQQVVRTARRQGVQLVAVDRFPRNLMREMRHQRRTGEPVDAALRRRMVDDRDVEMASELVELVADGRCERVLFSVGWNHLPGLTERLEGAGISVYATVVDHDDVPPLPDPIVLSWEDGRIAVE